jgi:peroxiredoxin
VRDEQNKYRARKVSTLGINPAAASSHEKYAAKFKFNFPLLSDPDKAVARDYHALKPDGGIARTVYLVGMDGRVRFAERGAPSADSILQSLS